MNVDLKQFRKDEDIPDSKYNTFEKNVRKTIINMLDKYDYESNDLDSFVGAMQYTTYKHIIQMNNELPDTTYKQQFNGIFADYKNPESDRAISSLSVLLGWSKSFKFNNDSINEDILMLSSKILAEKYSRD